MYLTLHRGVTVIPRLETLEKARVTEKAGKSIKYSVLATERTNSHLLGPRLSRINQDLASRPHFKILKTQVLGRVSYAPLTKVAVHYNSNEMNSSYKNLEELRTFLQAVLPVVTHLDTTAKPEIIEDWINSVALDSPTAHRAWLAIDDKLGDKAERAKLNNLLQVLFEAEEKLAVLVHRFSDTAADHKKVLGVIEVAIFAAKKLPRAELRKVLDKLKEQLCFLHGAHVVSFIAKSDTNDQVFTLGDGDSEKPL